MRKGTPGVFLAATLALSAGNAAAVPYSFTNIADTSGPFLFFGEPSLNNSGTVAFAVGGGIFTGRDPLADEVISPGDTLFGSTVTQVSGSTQQINDIGQIAFSYKLADGRTGVARADPLVILEPSTLPLLVAGLLGAMLWRNGKST